MSKQSYYTTEARLMLDGMADAGRAETAKLLGEITPEELTSFIIIVGEDDEDHKWAKGVFQNWNSSLDAERFAAIRFVEELISEE